MAGSVVSVQFWEQEKVRDTVNATGFPFIGEYTATGVGVWGKVATCIEYEPSRPLAWQILGGVGLCYDLALL